MKNTNNVVANRIREIRKTKKLNQTEVAQLLGMCQSNYSRLEKFDQSIDVVRLMRVAEILEVSAIELLYGKRAYQNLMNKQLNKIDEKHQFTEIIKTLNNLLNENTQLRNKLDLLQNKIDLQIRVKDIKTRKKNTA